MQAGLISDSLDFVTGPASSRLVGRRARPIGTMTVLPSLALDVIGLGRLAGTPDRPTDRPTDDRLIRLEAEAELRRSRSVSYVRRTRPLPRRRGR